MSTEDADGSKSDVECPTCGKTDFTGVAGMKRHHALAHDESIAGVEVACAWCGETKRVSPCEKAGKNNHFCDMGCKGNWWGENIRGETHPNWDGGPVTVECSYCGAQKKIPECYAEQRSNYFCDGECEGSWMSENLTGERAANWKGLFELTCEQCGDGYRVRPNRKGSSRFCSPECLAEWQAVHFTGENSPRWKGGTAPYGVGWNEEKRESVREQQDRYCAGCGEHESGLSRKLDVHHIRPARTFDDPAKRNDESNLVAMCHGCHQRWEGIPIRPT